MPLSYSQLQTYRRCPKQYEYAVIKKVSRPISPGESFGSSIHNTLKRWGELEMECAKNEKKMPANQLSLIEPDDRHEQTPLLTLNTLLTLWRECFISQGYASRPEMDARLTQGEAVLRHFFGWWSAQPRSVIGIETSFKLSVHSASGAANTISGRIDRIEQMQSGIRIVDFKTSEPQTQLQADNDLQLSIYSAAAHEKWGDAEQELVLLFLSEDGVTERRTQRSPGQRKDAMTAIRTLDERILSGDFRPTPSAGTCRHCPFRFICGARAV